MNLTVDQLRNLLHNNPDYVNWYNALIKVLPDYQIDTPPRLAAFISQCAHESADFTAVQENLNYKAESLMRTWPSHFPTMEIANQYAHNQEMIANRAYANRMGNGNEASGDGWKFCGRGLIQLTGRSNYQDFADSLSMSIDDVPAYLGTYEGAVQSACFFWENNNLNTLADSQDIKQITRVINGGELGLQDRMNRYDEAYNILFYGNM
jgi:putative chitinase